MSFGFPAYHEASEKFDITTTELNRIIKEVFVEFGWKLRLDSFTVLEASIPINWATWGQTITVFLSKEGMTSVKSENVFPTQCIDWGNNRRDVTRFISRVRFLESVTKAQRMIDGSDRDGDGISPLTKLFEENR
jgi:hypothetical protein